MSNNSEYRGIISSMYLGMSSTDNSSTRNILSPISMIISELSPHSLSIQYARIPLDNGVPCILLTNASIASIFSLIRRSLHPCLGACPILNTIDSHPIINKHRSISLLLYILGNRERIR